MAEQPKTPQAAPTDETTEKNNGRAWHFWPLVGLIVLTVTFVIGLVVALVLAIVVGSDDVANVVQIIRDIFIIVLAMEGMFVMIALIVLIVQIAALVNLLQSEVKPIVDNANETVTTVRGTAQFMSQNVVEPVIKFSALTAGLGGVLREALGIRRSLRRSQRNGSERSATDE